MTIPEIVTLKEAEDHLHQPDDPSLHVKIAAATEVICRRIANRKPADPDWVATIESWTLTGSPLVLPPPLVKLAVLEQVAEMYRFTGDDPQSERPAANGDLSDDIKRILKAGGYLTEAWA